MKLGARALPFHSVGNLSRHYEVCLSRVNPMAPTFETHSIPGGRRKPYFGEDHRGEPGFA
jgi:hypothetical protein